jgi:hypothetical protein
MAMDRTPDPGSPIISEPGSFPWTVLHHRHPTLLRQVLEGLPYPPVHQEAVEGLGKEITETIQPLTDQAPDALRWNKWAAEYVGHSWYEVPFLWAENYFYRKLLAAVGHLEPGPWQGVDPFGPAKAAELAGAAVDEELAALDGLPGLSAVERLDVLVSASLWGNRADLGFLIQAGHENISAGQADQLLVDDRPLLRDLLAGAAADRASVILVADNAGRELLPDLVLVDHLLSTGAGTVILHLKPRPYFVSDAMTADVLAAVRRLQAGPEMASSIGDRLWAALGTGQLVLRADPFAVAPLEYQDLTPDLRDEFSAAALTIMKGDLNYRRLVGDRHWAATASFAELTAHFPGPVVALRTLKSDVIVGLDEPTLARLEAPGQPWRSTGHYAVIQGRP